MADSHRADRQCHQNESDHNDVDASGYHVSTIVRQRLVRDRPNELTRPLSQETPGYDARGRRDRRRLPGRAGSAEACSGGRVAAQHGGVRGRFDARPLGSSAPTQEPKGGQTMTMCKERMKEQLYREAKSLNIKGRSKMNKGAFKAALAKRGH
jgi:hypothetical protein